MSQGGGEDGRSHLEYRFSSNEFTSINQWSPPILVSDSL
jgi:hypothetical protein